MKDEGSRNRRRSGEVYSFPDATIWIDGSGSVDCPSQVGLFPVSTNGRGPDLTDSGANRSIVTSQMNHHVIWIGWQQRCKRVSRMHYKRRLLCLPCEHTVNVRGTRVPARSGWICKGSRRQSLLPVESWGPERGGRSNRCFLLTFFNLHTIVQYKH